MQSASARRLNGTTALLLWAGLLLFGVFYGMWQGYGGRRFAVALAVGALLLAGEIFFAAPAAGKRLHRWIEGRARLAAPVVLFAVWVCYAAGASGFGARNAVFAAAYVFVPALLAASARGKPTGAWQDYAALLAIWLPPGFHFAYALWPYPERFTHTLTILFGVNVAITTFLLLRRLDCVGYAVEWKRGSSWAVGFNFLCIVAIVLPLGEALGFLHFDPTLARLRTAPMAAVGILFFTAWPEEFLFRGLLQNLLARTLKNPTAGLLAASVIFGLSHILHAPFPNWRYVIVATIAGFFYGRAWMKTGSLFAPCLVHALVDVSWHALFR